MQQRPLFQSLGVTAHQRIRAAAKAYRAKFITSGTRQITLEDIYRNFTSLTKEQQMALAEDELQTEIENCYAFTPFVELIREAHKGGLKIVIVSDTYLLEVQLRRLLESHLPKDVIDAINIMIVSSECGVSKSEGLFQHVIQKLAQPAQTILHIGDHITADFEAPLCMGLNALHFIQFDQPTLDFLHLQNTAASLNLLSKNGASYLREPRYSPFRSVYSATHLQNHTPEHTIGYMSFGPMLYAFSKFICDEIDELQKAGKRPKVFFLLRDAYLLSQACEAYAGKPVGKLVRLRKFVAVAVSFRTREDIDYYISGIEPQHFNFWVICEQLLLPNDLISKIVHQANISKTPEKTFYELLHQDNIMQIIFEKSSGYRERLKLYIKKEMNIESGDTVMLVDTGYVGVTQDFLTRTFKNELNVEIIGRYFIASHEPDRPSLKALMTTTWCDHTLFEQSCTYKEGSVINYDDEGNPVFDKLKLSDEQYVKVEAIQTACLQFIHDAKRFFTVSQSVLSLEILQETAIAALKRHIFFPTEAEVQYFEKFQHDKDMGHDLSKTVYNVPQCLSRLKYFSAPYKMNPYESRAASLDLTFSSLMQRAFDLDVKPADMNFCYENIKIVMINGNITNQAIVKANRTYDGYFTFTISSIANAHLAILFGESYQWLQIESITLLDNPLIPPSEIDKNIVLHEMKKNQNIFECQTQASLLLITSPFVTNTVKLYNIVFRPLIKR
jgi:FMN phosphatase YigB (HAD superfamily)